MQRRPARVGPPQVPLSLAAAVVQASSPPRSHLTLGICVACAASSRRFRSYRGKNCTTDYYYMSICTSTAPNNTTLPSNHKICWYTYRNSMGWCCFQPLNLYACQSWLWSSLVHSFQNVWCQTQSMSLTIMLLYSSFLVSILVLNFFSGSLRERN